MEFSRQPISPVFAQQEVTFRFKLEAWETPPADYDFRITDSAGNPVAFADRAGSAGGTITHRMYKDTVFQPIARFPGPGEYKVEVAIKGTGAWSLLDVIAVDPPAAAPVLKVALQTGSVPNSNHAVLWEFIRKVTEQLTFKKFEQFADAKALGGIRAYSPYGSPTYERLHEFSKEFVTETSIGNNFTSPSGATTADATDMSYVSGQVPLPVSYPLAVPGQYPTTLFPFVELIYVYWLEEGMLFQSLNRIIARFQNRRAPGGRDPLSQLAVSPLLPLRGLLWGLAEAEKDRLSLRRRAAEYEYQYGLQLIGRAVPSADLLVERRSQFLEAFHSLLNACYHFYREDSDKTVDADAFPLLSNLRELHLVLAHGANNQFTDVSLAARIETIDVQWMLAQPEMQEFLGARTMVPYDENWMSRVDSMKSVQGWSDTSVTHFYDLAVHGEQLLLSVRHGQWNSSGPTGVKEDDAKNWAKEWKQSVQRYIHAYRAVTGVDLSERVDMTMPSTLLQRRLTQKLARY